MKDKPQLKVVPMTIKQLTYSFLLTLSFGAFLTPAFADGTPAGVAVDVSTVQKDNQSLEKTDQDLAKDRAAKAQDKANGNLGKQAVDSVRIGADKVGRSAKQTEKTHDEKVLNSDVDSAVLK